MRATKSGFTTIEAVLAIIAFIIIVGGGIYLWRYWTGTSASPQTYTPPPAGSVQGDATDPDEILVTLDAQNNSGEAGAASIVDVNGKAKVIIDISNGTGGPQPAHIHVGACPNPGTVAFPLGDVVNGKSETVLPISVAELLGKLPLAINIHKSTTEAGVYVSCGDIREPVTKG